MKEMNYGFLPQYKIHNCCDRSSRKLPYRDFLRYVVFINGYAYATNLCIMARARIDKISNLRSEDIEMLNGRAIVLH